MRSFDCSAYSRIWNGNVAHIKSLYLFLIREKTAEKTLKSDSIYTMIFNKLPIKIVIHTLKILQHLRKYVKIEKWKLYKGIISSVHWKQLNNFLSIINTKKRNYKSDIALKVLKVTQFDIGSQIAQKMKFSIKDFFSKCDQILRKLRIWSYLLKKSFMENFVFLCSVNDITRKIIRLKYFIEKSES